MVERRVCIKYKKDVVGALKFASQWQKNYSEMVG